MSDTSEGHKVHPVAVDLVVTGEIVGYICRDCLRDCTRAGLHKAPSIGLERLGY